MPLLLLFYLFLMNKYVLTMKIASRVFLNQFSLNECLHKQFALHNIV